MTVAESRKFNREAAARKKANIERNLARREEARHLLKVEKYINQIHSAIDVLNKGWEKDSRAPDERLPLTRDRVTALAKAADLSVQMLKKVLPDVKAVELSDLREIQSNNEDVKELSTEQLLAVILEQRKATGDILDAEYREVPAPNTAPGAVPVAPWEGN